MLEDMKPVRAKKINTEWHKNTWKTFILQAFFLKGINKIMIRAPATGILISVHIFGSPLHILQAIAATEI